MPPSSNIQVSIESLDEQGRGVARLENQILKIPYVIPGEKIRLAFREISSFVATQRMPSPDKYKVIVTSSDRVEPPCPYFTRCGGCQLQHMSLERQLAEKQNALKRLIRGWISEEKIRPILPSPRAWNYRRRIQLHAGPRGELGFYAPLSHQVVDIQNCLIAEEALNLKIEEIRRQVAAQIESKKRATLLNYEMTVKPSGEVEWVSGEENTSFLQVNEGANQRLLEFLREVFQELKPSHVLELFAGDGNLTYPLRDQAQSWTAVESNSHAFEIAQRHPQAKSVQWMKGEAAKMLPGLSRRDFDLLLLDPPREGALGCIKPLLNFKLPAILYVSCSPSSLIRDLKSLAKGSFEVEWLQPLDFFPHTMHLETVALLRRT